MKDKIFIAWNGDMTVAKKVKSILEGNDYRCYIGGNEQNDSRNASVGDTVITQLKECNQAIIIFQNVERPNGLQISHNVFFELGYAFALYGVAKVHCVKKKSETIELPSDFDNSFVEGLDDKTQDTFAEEICHYFLNRQKMTLTVNKFELINNRYEIHEMLNKHYSDDGSKCSDYELAQYVLFYMLASQMFHDADRILDELEKFKILHFSSFSKELSLSLEFSIALLSMVVSIVNENGKIYISYDVYSSFENTSSHVISCTREDDVGDFYVWINMFVYEAWNYASFLISQNPSEVNEDERLEYLALSVQNGKKALEYADFLEATDIVKNNHDADGVLALIRSWVSRNLFLAYSDSEFTERNGIDTSVEQCDYVWWLEQAKNLRFDMMNSYKGALDTKLYDHFRIEYYLTICEYLKCAGSKLDATRRKRYKYGVETFLKEIRQQQRDDNVYIDKIELLSANG